jgi:hypothetical protein
VCARSEAVFAVEGVFAHFVGLAAGKTYIVVIALTGCIELIADAADLLVGVEVR